MSSDWKTASLDQFCDITRGASPRPIHDYLSDEGVPWIKIADATAETSRFINATREKIKKDGVKASVEVFPGDLILSNSATPGLPKFLNIQACIHDGWMLLRNFRNLDKEFAYWLLLNERQNLVAQGNGSVFTNLKTEILKTHTVSVPTLLIQKKIAQALNAIDDRITLLRDTNATLEAIAQAIFKSWFVDFDPVLAKSEGRLPNGVDEAIVALFPDALEESELGSIPRGWGIEPIGELLNRPRVSKRYTKNQVTDFGDYPVYEQGSSILLGFHNETPSCNASPEKPLFIFGDHTCITKISCEPFDISQNVILLEGSKRNSYWTYYAIQGKQHFEEYRRHWMELIVKKVVVPPFQICDAFAAVSKPLQLKIEANAKRIYTLKNLRDTLLPRLISGQIRIADAGSELEKATT